MADLHVRELSHPLMHRDLTILRNKDTSHGVFRSTLQRISVLLASEALRDLPVSPLKIETPIESFEGACIEEEVVLVPVLRAGLGLTEGFLHWCPDARVGHLGMYRDEVSHQPVDYYSSIPDQAKTGHVFVLDPMLATGGSATAAISHLMDMGAQTPRLVCLIAAPEGIRTVNESFPDVEIIVGAVDRELNDHAYICPGLGDAGDRFFGT